MKKIIIALIVLVLATLVFYSLNDSQQGLTGEAYKQNILKHREESDEYFKTDAESPIEDKSKFKGLKYYAIDEKYRIEAEVSLVSGKNENGFIMTDSTKGEYKKVGIAHFELNGKACVLAFYDEGEKYFIPFRDVTNGTETYGGGRYLSIEKTALKRNSMVIDFNEAYQPYCAYNHEYICPVPPKENQLSVEVRAGEKL